MRLAYFDCFSGASGDMIVGALLDAGLDLPALQAALAGLKLGGFAASAEKVHRGGLAGTKFNVAVEQAGQPHRHLDDILALIEAAGLPGRPAAIARAIFQRLGKAEAKVHGVELDHVHFHEVGAVDSIVDIVAAAVGLELLGIERVFCSPLPAGNGRVKTEHGVFPIPAPATAELLKKALVAPAAPELAGELTTPTGAAVLTTVAAGFGPMPEMAVSAVGYGAGSRDNPALPNLLRVFLGESSTEGSADTVVELSANLDDCTGQVLGATVEALLEAGCLDAWLTPIYMKKSRPAWMLSALCAPADVGRIERLLFAETTTLGIRRRLCQRSKLSRRHVTVETPYGPIRVKIGSLGEPGPTDSSPDLTAAPEFAHSAAAAAAHGVAVREVIAAAQTAYRGRETPPPLGGGRP